jgi:mono/diheme cytochrome c family protein
MSKNTTRPLLLLGVTTLSMSALTGCHLDMWIQPKVKGQSESKFFADKSGSRLPVSGTVARGHFKEDIALNTGYEGDKLATQLPPQVLAYFAEAIGPDGKKQTLTEEQARLKMLQRGQNRYKIYCTPCHGQSGDGNGMIAIRGLALRRPPGNYHTDRLREMPIGHFYDVIVNGYGSMYSYASRIQSVHDRWAVAAYIRVLQRSQNATANDVPEDKRARLESGGTVSGAAQAENGSRAEEGAR